MSDFTRRKETRIERIRAAAARHQEKATAAFEGVARVAESIPMGQPILCGHHSEGRHRADLDRMDRGMRRSVEEQKRAEELARRAEAAENNTAISSDDPDALDALRDKLAKLEKLRTDLTRLNREWRKGGAAALTGVTEEQRAEIVAFIERRQEVQPAPRYKLANLGGQIRQVKQRIANLEKSAAVPSSEERIGAVVVRDNAEANRVQLVFLEVPDAETRADLKRAGFRWAPSVGAWQRNRSNAALHEARRIAGGCEKK